MPSGAPSSAGLLGSGGGEKRDSVNCQKSVCRISPVGASSSNSAGGGVSPASSSVIFVVLGVAFLRSCSELARAIVRQGDRLDLAGGHHLHVRMA